MSESKILIPVKIEALVVDEATSGEGNWKDFSLDYEEIYKRMGVQLETAELKQLQSDLCAEGIHLHWALPAALTNGVYINKEMVFPAVPNRWLIVRTHVVAGKPITKKWIIESDADDGTSPWVIQESNGAFQPTSIGRLYEISSWKKESKRLVTPLTAVAPGNPTFAAVYQTCRNVFGFHDDLKGLDSGVFSYLVTGWYSDPAIDPLISAPEPVKKNLRDKWSVNSADDFPSSVFCHGFIHSVNWERSDNYAFPEQETKVNVGIGYTSVEAKSTQIASQTGAAEKVLGAYFYDILKNVEGAAQIESQVDGRAFSSLDGGSLWEIRRTEDTTKSKEGKELKTEEFPEERKNPGLSNLFKELNNEQRNLDRMIAERLTMLVEFRAFCDKLIREEVAGTAVYRNSIIAKRKLLQEEISAITAQIARSRSDIVTCIGKIKALDAFKEVLVAGVKKTEYELVEAKMPRFWRPNDPLTLFSGPGVSKSFKYAGATASGKLQCRLVAETISGLRLFGSDAIGIKDISPADVDLRLTPLGSLTAGRIDVVNKLHVEALLLDPQWAWEWALKYFGSSDRKNVLAIDLGTYLKNVLAGTEDGSNNKLRAFLCANGTALADVVKDKVSMRSFYDQRAILTWKHPWTPVHMIWYAKWIPSYKVESKSCLFAKDSWEWKDKKYKYTGADPKSQGSIEYSGKTILTDGINAILQQRLPPGTGSDHNIAQALDSFSDALLMRRQAIQLPLLKNEKDLILRDRSFDPYLTNEAYFFPATDAQSGGVSDFFPVRAGHLRITRLWITDAFGQVQKVVDTDSEQKVSVTGNMYVSGDLKSKYDDGLLTLLPRIVQPSRLSFRWLNAGAIGWEESSADPATSPVCGWVIPDFLDESLHVYDATGKSCGSLKMIDKKVRRLNWLPAPGRTNAATPESAVQNRFLLRFVNGLLEYRDNKDRRGVLSVLFDLCNDTAKYIDAASSQHAPGMAGLVGQPLALVRASLKLDLLGLPAQPQGWNDGFAPGSKKAPPGLTGIEFPVSLGDSRNSKDALVGYFTDKVGFGKMFTAFGRSTTENAYFAGADVKLSFKPEDHPEGITLLMDPRGGVQADCGILPSKFIDLPHVFTEKALKSMELHLLVAPFLGSPDNPDIPVGTESGNDWVLLQNTTSGRWVETKIGGQAQLQTNGLNKQRAQEGYLVLRPGTDNQ